LAQPVEGPSADPAPGWPYYPTVAGDDRGSTTKRERREAARREREELLERAARRKRRTVVALVGLAAVAAIAVVLALTIGRSSGLELLTGPAPWPSNTEGLATRM